MIGLVSHSFASLGASIGAALAAPSGPLAQVQRVPVASLHPSWCPAWAFWIIGALTIGGALVTITRKNLISAVMSLVATFFGLASLYALLSAHFLAAIQVLVYAGAIMVLFVFVIMVLNREEEDPWALRSPVAKALGTGALVYLLVRLSEVILSSPRVMTSSTSIPSAGFGSVAAMGEHFFTKFLFPFEAISILLVIAVIGAVVLSRSVSRPTSVHDLPKSEQPIDPAKGGGDAQAATHGSGGH